MAAAEANLERAERDLERAEIAAPYAGRIRQKNVDIGQFVTVGSAVATIYAIDVAEVRLPLPDEQLAYLNLPLSYRGASDQPQPRVTLRTTFAGETHEWKGRIVRTESEIDPVSRMVHVVAEVQDPYAPGRNRNRPPLAAGMYVEAEIRGRTVRDIAVVPRAALRGRDQILVADPEDRLSFRDIDILRTTTESLFVHDGLAEGELVVVSPLDAPIDGMRVQLLADADPDVLARRRGTPPASLTPAPPVLAEAPPAPGTTVVARVARDAPPAAPAGTPNDEPARTLNEVRVARADRGAAPATPAPSRPPERTALRRDAAPADPAPPLAAAPRPANSVAVALFATLNPETGDPELGRRLARAVSEQLASVTAVTVAGSKDAARYVVGGGVQQVGPMVRVTARIVDTADGAVVRAIKVDGRTDDVAGLRTEVVASIGRSVEALVGASTRRSAEELVAGARAPVRAVDNTLAVLPFDDLGASGDDPADVDLGRAITDTVAARLADLPAVTIVASDEGAAWVIGGGIQRIGGLVRVTARVIDTASGAVIRAVKVDGTLENLAELRDRVAAAVGQGVQDVLADRIDVGADATRGTGGGRRS